MFFELFYVFKRMLLEAGKFHACKCVFCVALVFCFVVLVTEIDRKYINFVITGTP